MPKKLTEQDKAAYVADPGHCPFCKSKDISAGSFDGPSQEVGCEDCGEIWFDIYTLIGVESYETRYDDKGEAE